MGVVLTRLFGQRWTKIKLCLLTELLYLMDVGGRRRETLFVADIFKRFEVQERFTTFFTSVKWVI